MREDVESLPETQTEFGKNRMKRVEVNDPVAMCYTGERCYQDGNYEGALEYWSKVAEMGDVEEHFRLSILYDDGKGVWKDSRQFTTGKRPP